MKTSMKALYLLSMLFLVACNPRLQQQEKSLSEQRAETDTVLAFQGIRISEPLDSARYYELVKDLPVKLYTESKDEFTFDIVQINDGTAYPGDIVHRLSLQGNVDKSYNFLHLIGLYVDNYGDFSYYQRLDQEGEAMGTFPLGEKSELSGKPWTYQDAMNDFMEHWNSTLYQFVFVWEWKNQSVILLYNPHELSLNSSVIYLDDGFTTRQAEEKRKQRLKEAEERQIEEAIKRQQI